LFQYLRSATLRKDNKRLSVLAEELIDEEHDAREGGDDAREDLAEGLAEAADVLSTERRAHAETRERLDTMVRAHTAANKEIRRRGEIISNHLTRIPGSPYLEMPVSMFKTPDGFYHLGMFDFYDTCPAVPADVRGTIEAIYVKYGHFHTVKVCPVCRANAVPYLHELIFADCGPKAPPPTPWKAPPPPLPVETFAGPASSKAPPPGIVMAYAPQHVPLPQTEHGGSPAAVHDHASPPMKAAPTPTPTPMKAAPTAAPGFGFATSQPMDILDADGHTLFSRIDTMDD
jgi:hypothetical protein